MFVGTARPEAEMPFSTPTLLRLLMAFRLKTETGALKVAILHEPHSQSGVD
jgi:hypothetical protein